MILVHYWFSVPLWISCTGSVGAVLESVWLVLVLCASVSMLADGEKMEKCLECVNLNFKRERGIEDGRIYWFCES